MTLTEKGFEAITKCRPNRRRMKFTMRQQNSLETSLIQANVNLEAMLQPGRLGYLSMQHYRDIELKMVDNDILINYIRRTTWKAS